MNLVAWFGGGVILAMLAYIISLLFKPRITVNEKLKNKNDIDAPNIPEK